MAKGRKTGGRVAGVPNKANRSLREAAGEYTEEALGVLVTAMRGEMPHAMVAADKILDRGHGKPSQSTEISGPNGGPVEVNDTSSLELARRIAFLLTTAKPPQ